MVNFKVIETKMNFWSSLKVKIAIFGRGNESLMIPKLFNKMVNFKIIDTKMNFWSSLKV